MTSTKKTMIASLVALASLVAVPAQADTLASWTSQTFTTNNSNQLVQNFAAQSSDLYIQLSLTPKAGAISENDFTVLWLDNTTTGDHTGVANIGLKADIVGAAGDYMVRGNSTQNFMGAYTTDQAAIGKTVNLYAHLYKSAGSLTYDRFDLWSNPVTSSWNALLATAPEATSTLNTDLSSISTVGFRTATLASGDQVTVNSAAVFNAIPAVPEPESYAMFLAGLGLMAGIARRRTRR